MGGLPSQDSSLKQYEESFEALFRPGQIVPLNTKLYVPVARKKVASSDVRVMQWNLLADGLSRDGFVTNMCTQEFEDTLKRAQASKDQSQYVPAIPVVREEKESKASNTENEAENDVKRGFAEKISVEGSGMEGFTSKEDMISAVEALGKLKGAEKEDACSEFVSMYDTPAARNNLNVVTSFRGRLLRFLVYIQAVQPDILTVQELDHYEDFSEALSHLGYTSKALPRRLGGHRRSRVLSPRHRRHGQKSYVPFWRRRPGTYIEMLRDCAGCCFAPKRNSKAFALSAEFRTNFESDLRGGHQLGALRGSGMGSIMFNKFKNSQTISVTLDDLYVTSKRVKEIRSTDRDSIPQSLAKIGVTGPLDDDGVAIFWRKSRFSPESTAEFHEISKGQGAVKVTLKDNDTGKLYVVVAAHLRSGQGEKACVARAEQIRNLKSFISRKSLSTSSSEGSKLGGNGSKLSKPSLILGVDANASPFEHRIHAEVKAKLYSSNLEAPIEEETEIKESISENLKRGLATPPAPSANPPPPPKNLDISKPEEKLNTFMRLKRLGLSSCWDAMLKESKKKGGEFFAVTSNKIRGPLSNQHEKIGYHSLSTIDYILFSPDTTMSQFALAPQLLGEGGKFNRRAMENLIPSMKVPSDHYPVAVDLRAES